MNLLYTDQIWSAVIKDPKYKFLQNEILAVFEPYVKNLPESLEALLDQPVTVSTVLAAKVIFFKALAKSPFSAEIAEIQGLPQNWIQFGVDFLYYGYLYYQENLDAEVDVTKNETYLLGHPLLAVQWVVIQKILTEGMTIRQLLATQPVAIVDYRIP